MKSLSLRLKLIGGLLVIGAILTLITSVMHSYWDYQDGLNDMDRDFKITEDGAVPILEFAMWSLDKEQVQLTLKGILTLPSIQLAEIYDDKGIYSARGELPKNAAFKSQSFTLRYDNNQPHILGHLTVYASFQPIYDHLYQEIGRNLVTNALRIFIMTLFITLFFNRLITRHIRKIVNYFDASIEEVQKPLILDRQHKSRDELDDLTDTVNHLYARLYQHNHNIENEKNRYLALVENNPQIIWCCELTTPIPIEQDGDILVEALQHNAILAEVNQAAASVANIKNIVGSSWQSLPFIQVELWQKLVKNDFQVKDFVSHCVDNLGKHRFFSNSLTCIINNNQLQTIWGIAIDVTQRISAQAELEEREKDLLASQERLAEAQALAHMGHWSYETDKDQLLISDEFARIYGLPERRTIAWSELITRIHPDDRKLVMQALSDIHTDTVAAGHRIIWPNGEERHVQAMARKKIVGAAVVSTFGIIMDITDRRRAEEGQKQSQQALVESEARMAEAQAIAHMGHWILDNQTRVLTCSDEFYRLHQRQPQHHPADILTLLEHVHPQDRERMEAFFNYLGERPRSEDYRVLNDSGDVRYMRGTITPFYSSEHVIERLFGISIDITERKLAEIKLQASQELLSKAFEASPDGIVFIDSENLSIIEFNRAFVDISGHDESTLIGHGIQILDRIDSAPKLSQALANNVTAHNVEINLEKGDGTSIICLLSWRRVDLRGRACTLAMLRDITTLRALEQTAEQQQKQLMHADQLAALGTMVAGVAHEINNPNHLIQMNAELLESFTGHLIQFADEISKRDSLNRQLNGISLEEIISTTPELLEDIKVSSRRIDRIVKDLKDFSRPRDHGEFTPTDLNSIIRKSRNLLASTLEQHNQQVVFELIDDLPRILGDAQQLEQVIVNLVANALEASPPDGTVMIKTYTLDHQVICEIMDRGCGIPEDQLKHIFDPFFTTKQEHGGTGLGLAISFRLVREHNGQLETESVVGKGTTLRIRFPASDADQNS